MRQDLLFLAGNTAYRKIREGGLSPDDIKVAVGASGAAKWLVLHGLDTAVFAHWFRNRKEPLHLFGTSIGAWKFAAAAQNDPAEAFDRLAHSYIHQYYDGRSTREQVVKEAHRIMDDLIPANRIREIISHPFYRFSLSAVRCRGWIAGTRPPVVFMGLMAAFASNLISRNRLNRFFERTLFFDPRTPPPFCRMEGFPLHRVPLSPENFRKALLASGSIPLAMEGVTGISGAPEGMYRDGGILDYHPVLPPLPEKEGLVLYPHFYPEVIPGWFDKKLSHRKASASQLDNVLLLAPSPTFVSKLPFGRIPDRKDFNRMAGKDKERIDFWETTVKESRRLGDVFLEAVESGKIKEQVRKIT